MTSHTIGFSPNHLLSTYTQTAIQNVPWYLTETLVKYDYVPSCGWECKQLTIMQLFSYFQWTACVSHNLRSNKRIKLKLVSQKAFYDFVFQIVCPLKG